MGGPKEHLIVKMKSGGQAVEMAYNVLKSINLDFVAVYNGFNYNPRYMAASCADIEGITVTFDERRSAKSASRSSEGSRSG